MIYLDNAATTRLDEECLEVIKEYGIDKFYNPSALYRKAMESGNAVKNARNVIGKSLGVRGEEIIFTASGSESDNIALLCSVRAKTGKIVVGSCEHSAVYNTALELKVRGYDVVFAPCDQFGKVAIDKLEELLDEKVVLVSVMHVCNETGAINEIAKIAEIVKRKSPRAIFHSDGVQAYGKIPVNLKSLGVDLYSISGHKINAGKGVGALYCRSGLYLKTFVYGGGQEGGIRSATENLPGIMSFACAVENNFPSLQKNYQNIKLLQYHLAQRLDNELENIKINTDIDNSSPYIYAFALNSARGEVMVHCLEDKGIIVGTGSACNSKKSTKRIPQALGIDGSFAEGMMRISFDKNSSIEDVDAFVDALKESLSELVKFQNKSVGKDDCILSRLKLR